MMSASEFERFLLGLRHEFVFVDIDVVFKRFYQEYGDILEIEKGFEENNITFGGSEDEEDQDE